MHPKRANGKKLKGRHIRKDREGEGELRGALPGAAACWLSAEAGAGAAVAPGVGRKGVSCSKWGLEGTGLQGQTKSDPVCGSAWKTKAVDRCDIALSSSSLNRRKRR